MGGAPWLLGASALATSLLSPFLLSLQQNHYFQRHRCPRTSTVWEGRGQDESPKVSGCWCTPAWAAATGKAPGAHARRHGKGEAGGQGPGAHLEGSHATRRRPGPPACGHSLPGRPPIDLGRAQGPRLRGPDGESCPPPAPRWCRTPTGSQDLGHPGALSLTALSCELREQRSIPWR